MAHIRGKDCAKKSACNMADQRDIVAAHILVELANGVLRSPKTCLGSLKRDLGVAQKLNDELPTTMWSDNRRQHANEFVRSGEMKKEAAEKLNIPHQKTNHTERKEKKRKVGNGLSLPKSKKYRNFFVPDNEKEKDLTSKLAKKSHPGIRSFEIAGDDGFAVKYFGSKKTTKTREAKAGATHLDGPDGYGNLRSGSKNLMDRHTYLKKKRGAWKSKTGSLGSGIIYSKLLSERGITDDVVPVIRPAKKQKVTLITPTILSGFSFSIIHLLSAVRVALVTGKVFQKGNSEQMAQERLSSLTIHQIVQRVRSNPGDPCILETKEPLLDLVRGVLRIFSSKLSPLRAKGWKALTMHERSSKSWSWIGPVSSNLSHDDHIWEETSPEAWGIPQRILGRLVDCFANWLKNGQETLQQIRNLPPPPMILMQLTKSEERFKDMRAQRSQSTIKPSCDEVRAYFRREETLRYLNPDQAFSYTAVDGRKSSVAPIRRSSGKPSGKARDHFMLKIDRPPNFTVLCLVRDATARLPDSIGTRADVCTLVRDSQFIVDDISELQINQVVSGALDRLHYETDPCVKFDKHEHFWVYLHGEREEEEFENYGSASRKKGKWKGENHRD